MNGSSIFRKLTSRKLWIALIGVVVGLAAAFGINENEYAQIAGVATSAVSVVAYVLGESRVDSAGAMPINLHIDENGGAVDPIEPVQEGEDRKGD